MFLNKQHKNMRTGINIRAPPDCVKNTNIKTNNHYFKTLKKKTKMEQIKLTKPQENKLSTFGDIETVLENNISIINTIPEFINTKSEFSNVISSIRAKAVRKGTVMKGMAQTKSMKRIELESVILENSSALYILGNKKSNEIIKAISKLNQSELDRFRDSEIVNKANAILHTMEENAVELANYGKDSDAIEKLKACILNYKNSTVEKSTSTTEKTLINVSLAELFKKGMELLENEIDKFVDSQKATNREFYISYYTVRTIKHLGVRHKKPVQTQPVA